MQVHSVWKSQKKSHSMLRAKQHSKMFFWKPETCCQTVLPDRLLLIGQNRWKIPKCNWYIPICSLQSLKKLEYFFLSGMSPLKIKIIFGQIVLSVCWNWKTSFFFFFFFDPNLALINRQTTYQQYSYYFLQFNPDLWCIKSVIRD